MVGKYELVNIFQMGVGFGLLFAAYQSCANIQQFVMSSVITDRNGTGPPIDTDAGYISSAIVYGFFTVFNFFAPPIVDTLHEKWSMVLGVVPYLLLILSFFYITNILFYVCSALVGCGAAVLWVGQGTYFAKNSSAETASRNSGVFWALYESSLIIGGIFVYFELLSSDESDNNYLSSNTITIIYVSFSILAALGILVLALLRKPKQIAVQTRHTFSDRFHRKCSLQPMVDFAATIGFRIIKLMATKPMILLSIVFAFTGLELSFFLGVYGTSMADILAIPAHKTLLSLNPIFVGIGEILGGCIFGIFGKKLNRFGRIPIIQLAMTLHMTAFLLVFLNIPSTSPLYETNDIAYINPPNQYLALFCSFLLGFADSCWATQIFSLISSYYANDSAPAFALNNFYRSAAACCAFFYSTVLTLQWQLLIIAIFCPIAAVAFIQTEFITRKG